MNKNIQKIQFSQLKGRVCKDPDLRMTTTGKQVLTFTLAYNTLQKTDNEGSHSNFILVEVWDKTAEIFHPLLVKGLEILVHGNIVQNRWKDDNGKVRSNYKFCADTILITDFKLRLKNQKEDVA